MIAFCCEYWNWLLGRRKDEPKPEDHGLDERMAELLRNQCRIEYRVKRP